MTAYDGLRARAERGRRDAVENPTYGGPATVIVYSRRDIHAAAVAFWRACGIAGHRNRHNRCRPCQH